MYQQSVAILAKVIGERHSSTQFGAENLRQLQDHLNGKYHVIVKKVLPKTQETQLGIQVGDIFTHYDHQAILGVAQFIQGRAKEPADGALPRNSRYYAKASH